MKANDLRYTLDEHLMSTNEEIKSNWLRLASFIQRYEQISYDAARIKARDLIKINEVDEYLENARKNPNGLVVSGGIDQEAEQPEVTPPVAAKSTEQKAVSKSEKFELPESEYERNYKQLIRIAPDLEEQLFRYRNGTEVKGESKVTGTKDLHLLILQRDKKGFYITLANYRKNNGTVPDPEMGLFIDLHGKIVFALSYMDAETPFKAVFDNCIKRQKTDLQEQKTQNAFLGNWLKKLKAQNHRISFEEPEDESASFIVDHFNKKAEPEQEPELKKNPEPEEVPKTETVVTEKAPLEPVVNEPELNHKEEHPEPKVMKPEEKPVKQNETPKKQVNELEKERHDHLRTLQQINYKLLSALIPEIGKKGFEGLEEPVKLVSGTSPVYDFVSAKRINAATAQVAVYEQNGKGGKNAAIILGMVEARKLAWVVIWSDSFFGVKDYHCVELPELTPASFEANKALADWLIYLHKLRYAKRGTENAAVTEEKQASKAKANPSEDHPLSGEEKIPHFEVGKVQLTQQHIKAGLTQKDIDYINEHKSGMTLRPIKRMVNNTKSKEMDREHFAMRPGFRVSKTGQIYYESRSNRADKGNNGL